MPRQSRWFPAAVLILLAAAILRLAALGHIPPGLPFEEASLAAQAVYPPAPLTPGPGLQWITYLMSASLALFGHNPLGVRLVAALCGLLTIAFTYRWIGALYRRRVALVAAALLAISFWPLYFSRIGLGAVTLPPLLALASWLYARALARIDSPRSPLRFGLAGLAVGAALYSPPGAWLAPIVFAGLYVYFLLARRDALRASSMGHLSFWGAALAAGLPLVIAQGVSPTPQMQALADALGKGNAGPLLDALDRAGSMWTTLGDGLFHYNVGIWPVFNVVLATIFVIGLFHPVAEQAAPDPESRRGYLGGARALIPLWLIAGVVASALTDPERPFTTGIIAMPATYVTLALGFELIGRLASASAGLGWLARRWRSVLAAALVLAAAEGAWSYFVVGPNDPLAQGDYHTDLLALARDIHHGSADGGLAISTAPPHNVAPLIFEFLPHSGRPVHWFDASIGLIIPASPGGSPAEVYIPEAVQVSPRLVKYLGQPSPAAPGIRRYEVTSRVAFLRKFPPPLDQRMWVADAAAFPPDDPDGVRQEVSQPIWFGDIVELAGYQSDTSRQAGKPVRITLVWRVLRDVDPLLDLSMFAHLLTPDGQLAAQTDRLAAPSSTWRGGDILIELQDIPTEESLAPGLYHLQIGLYNRADTQRLPVMVGGNPVGDRLLLEPVEITAP